MLAICLLNLANIFHHKSSNTVLYKVNSKWPTYLLNTRTHNTSFLNICTQYNFNFFNWNRFHFCFFPMITLFRNQFISLPYKLVNWCLYNEIVDWCEVYLILTIENYIFRVLSHDFQYTVISVLWNLSNNFQLTKLLLSFCVLNTILLFYSYFCIVTYGNGFIASCNIFLLYISKILIMDFQI